MLQLVCIFGRITSDPMKKIALFAIPLMVFVLTAFSCKEDQPPETPTDTTVHVTGVSLDKPELTLTVGDVENLIYTIAPEDASNSAVTWNSDDVGIATVDNDGKVTAIAKGETAITATTEDGSHTATCAVTVELSPPTIIYVAGYCFGADRFGKACLWTDGVAELLDIPESSYASAARSVCVSDGKVYIAGQYYIGNQMPCYWLDGVRTNLGTPISTGYGDALSITVVEGSIYVSGDYLDDGKKIPCYWKDGTCITLDAPNPPKYSDVAATSLVVSEGVVHIAGYCMDGSKNTACLWVNGVRKDLDIPDVAINSYGRSLAVSNGKVYIVGNYTIGDKSIACLWVDNTRVDLVVPEGTTESNCYSLAVSDGKVYLAGYYMMNSKKAACLWIDGECNDMNDSGGAVFMDDSCSVVVFNGEVYAAGSYTGGVCLWTNGESSILAFPTWAARGYVTSVAAGVVEK